MGGLTGINISFTLEGRFLIFVKKCMQIKWKGVFPALTTKFNADGSLDMPTFTHNLTHQLAAGVHGIILGGTLGEASVLEEDEKEMLVKYTLETCRDKVPVILNIAEGSTAVAVQKARLAESWGVDGLMLLPPMRYKADDTELFHFFSTIAASTSLPIMIYNNPVDYKNLVTLDVFEQLLTRHPNIQAVKESTRDVSNVTRMRNRFGDRISILCGVDTLAMESFVLGADGGVAGLVCAFPKETVQLYNDCMQGKWQQAQTLYRWFLPLLELDIHPKLVQYIKLAEQMCGLGTEHVRPPRLPLTGEEREAVMKIIEAGIRNRPQR